MATSTAKKTSPEDWHPADIKAALDKKGWTLTALAKHHGLKASNTLSHTFERSLPINEQRIADAIGVPVQDIWPSRYHADGTKKPRGLRGRRVRESTSAACHINGNNKKAA